MGTSDPSTLGIAPKERNPEAWAAAILEHLPYPTYVFDIRSEKLVYANPAFENDPHLSPEAILSGGGNALREIFHPDDLELVEALHRAWFKGSSDEDFVAEFRLRSPTGEWIWYQSTHRVLQRDSKGYAQLILATSQDITDRKVLQDAIYNVASGTAALTGETFFNKLVEHLAHVLDADYSFVGDLPPFGESRVDTLAAFADGESIPNFEYDLKDTPCADVLANPVTCLFPSDVQEHYPDDDWLKEQDIHGYAGCSLRNSEGRPVGILNVLTRSEFSNPSLVSSVLEIFAARAAGELERRRAENRLQERIQFEELAAQLAAELLDLTMDQFPDALHRHLELIAKVLDVDNLSVSRHDENGMEAFQYHWRIDTGGEQVHDSDAIRAAWPWLSRHRFTVGEPICIEDIENMPAEAIVDKQSSRSTGLESILWMPVYRGQSVDFVISASTRNRKRSWDEEVLRRTHFIGDIIAQALDRVYAQELLQASEQEYRTLFNSFSHPISIVNSEGRILMMNEPLARSIQGKSEDFIGHTFEDSFPDLHELTMQRYRDVAESSEGCHYEDELELNKGPQWFWSHVRHIPWRGEPLPVAQIVSYEITDLKMAQRQQLKQQAFNALVSDQFAELLQAESSDIRDAIRNALAKVGNFVNVERIAFFARAKTGTRPEPIAWSEDHLPRWSVTDPADAANQWKLLREGLLSEGRFTISNTDTFLYPSEKQRKRIMETGYRSVTGQLLADADGSSVLMAAVTESFEHPWDEDTLSRLRIFGEMICTALQRVRLMESVSLNEEHLRLATKAGNLGTWVITLDPLSLNINESFSRQLGFDRGTYVPSSEMLERHVHPDDFPRVSKQFLKTLKGERDSFQAEYRFFNPKTKKYIWVVSRARVVERDSKGAALRVAGTHQDITAQKETEIELRERERELRQSQKMEAVGQLAGGIAHDFNNLLQAIQGFTELTLAAYPMPEGAVENLNEVSAASSQAADLVKQLLTFTRADEARFETVSISDILSKTAKLLDRVIGKSIDLEIQATPDLPPVWADSGNITQVLINLCVNARDAMPDGGILSVSSNTMELTEQDCTGRDWVQPGNFVCAEVRDNGAGIPTHLIERVFEPFFTTKGTGEGTGMGLAMAYAIAQQHKGLLTVESIPSVETVFRLYLPAVAEDFSVAAELASDSNSADALGESSLHGTSFNPATERNTMILLAEDEELVRSVAIRLLENAGYQVLAAEDGEEAVRLYNQHKDDIDAAVLDVIMPKASGHEVCAAIREVDSKLPILLTTGYTHEALNESELTPGNIHVLRKPYRSAEFLNTLQDIIARAKLNH